jgi:hypothetical protein
MNRSKNQNTLHIDLEIVSPAVVSWQRISVLCGLLPKCVFAHLRPEGALRFSKSLFDNSKARLHCKSKTRPSGLRQLDLLPFRLVKNCYRKDLDSRLRAPFRSPGQKLAAVNGLLPKSLRTRLVTSWQDDFVRKWERKL